MELSEATGGFTEGMVGIGAFGTVFRAKVRGNGPYAIKKLHTVRNGVGGERDGREGGGNGRGRGRERGRGKVGVGAGRRGMQFARYEC